MDDGELGGGWKRGPRPDPRFVGLSSEKLAMDTSPEADREKERRAREEACYHRRPRRLGQEHALHCPECGARWTQPPPAPDGPQPILSTSHFMARGLQNSAEWRASRARAEAQVAAQKAKLFPTSAIYDLQSLLEGLRRIMALKGADEKVLDRFDELIGTFEEALRSGTRAADDMAELAFRVENATLLAEEAARAAMVLIEEVDGESLEQARKWRRM